VEEEEVDLFITKAANTHTDFSMHGLPLANCLRLAHLPLPPPSHCV
jgi:hypothetical protein